LEKACFHSPLGAVELSIADGRLSGVQLLPSASAARARSGRHSQQMRQYLGALERYFGGRDPGLQPGDLDFGACTTFARRVYRSLMSVGFGQVVTYGALARLAGSPGAARAVGQAMGRNPLPLFVPCHRVVAADHGLGGFGAGLRWKAGLLRHEGWSVSKGRIS
jgi:methylated-DNA-[protein]-cysteine S-methyltransferase